MIDDPDLVWRCSKRIPILFMSQARFCPLRRLRPSVHTNETKMQCNLCLNGFISLRNKRAIVDIRLDPSVFPDPMVLRRPRGAR